MPRLDNHRHEKFCQEYILNNGSGAGAYRKVYGENVLSAKENAWELLTYPHIQARIDELREKGDNEFALTMRERRRFALRTVNAMPHKFDFEKDGDLVTEIEYHEDGSIKKFKISDKLAAVMADAKLAGELPDKPSQNLNVTVNTIVITPERQAEIAAKKQAAIERRRQLRLQAEKPKGC